MVFKQSISENQPKKSKTERVVKQRYKRPQLKKLGSVGQLTLKMGSAVDGMGGSFGDGGTQ